MNEMAESEQHKQLVDQIISEVIKVVEPENHCFVCSDKIDGFALTPSMNEGFRPDVYYQYEDTLIIGEAKTSEDIERIHSYAQYESYIKKCSLFQGNALFIIAVPWIDHAVANNIIKRISKKYPGDYKIKILDGIGGAI